MILPVRFTSTHPHSDQMLWVDAEYSLIVKDGELWEDSSIVQLGLHSTSGLLEIELADLALDTYCFLADQALLEGRKVLQITS